MGRAEERRARQRGGGGGRRRAKPRRGSRAKPRNGGGIGRLFTAKKLLGAFLTVCLLGIGGFILLYFTVEIPNANAAAQAQSNTYTYRDGSILTRVGEVNRETVPLTDVPKPVQHTFVAAENKTFYTDSGIDVKGIARGLVNTVTGKGKQGGSTITQQWVKNYFLTQEQTFTRKAKELIISLKVDQQRSKDEILAGYINTSYYGRGAFGIQAAARAYYDVDAKDLTVEQGAYLAALLQAPSQYEWSAASTTSRKLVLQRWNYVLDNMVEMKWLDPGKRQKMRFQKPVAPKPAPGLQGQAGYIVKAARAAIIASGIDEKEFDAGGWTVRLGIDKKKQHALEQAVKSKLLRDLDPKKRKVDANVQPGAVSVDPRTGSVVALYGGKDFVKHQISNATRRDYQPASTFKPLILAAALETGAKTQDGRPIRANTIYDGTSKRHVKGSITPFAPPNEDDIDYGPVTVQKAMSKSINSVFAQMAVDVGLPQVKQTAIGLGLYKNAGGFDVRPAMSLGVMEASPLDMAGVYATLDHHGRKVTPRLVESAKRGDQQADLPDPIGDEVVQRTTADTVTSVLTGVVHDGTGAAVRSRTLSVAGKTGTSDDNRSAWFTGYTPRLVTSVGLFGEDAGKNGKHTTLKGAGGGGRVNGGGYPAQIWAAYTEAALSGQAATAEFDLDTTQGAAITPTPTATETTQSADPTVEPTHTQESRTPDPGPTAPSTPPPPEPTTSAPEPPVTSEPPTYPGPGPTTSKPGRGKSTYTPYG